MPPKRPITNDPFDAFLTERADVDYYEFDLDDVVAGRVQAPAQPQARRARVALTPAQRNEARRARYRAGRIARGLPVREAPQPGQPRVALTPEQKRERRRERDRARRATQATQGGVGAGARRVWQIDGDFIVDDWEVPDTLPIMLANLELTDRFTPAEITERHRVAVERYNTWQTIFRNTGAVRARSYLPRRYENGRWLPRQLQTPPTNDFNANPIPNTVRQTHDLVVRQLDLKRGRPPRPGQPDNRAYIDYIRHFTYISEGRETKKEAVARWLENVIQASGITYVFNYTAITMNEMEATQARGLLGNVARDGLAPRLWIDQVREVYAVPNQKQTCVQDIARESFGKRFAKQTDDEIMQALKSAFHKHGRKLSSTPQIWGNYETDVNFQWQMSLIVNEPLPNHQTCAFELVCLAYEMRRNITIVDIDNVLFAQTSVTDEFDTNGHHFIMVLVANGHMYNITCPEERKRIGSKRNSIVTKQFAPKADPVEPTHLVIHDREELAQRVMSEESTIIHTGCSLEFLVVDMFKNDKTTICDRFVKSNRGIITSLRVRNHQVILEERASDAQYLADRFSLQLRNKTMSAIGREYFESLVPMSQFRSFFHDDVYAFVRSAILHGIQYQSDDIGHNQVCIDQKRCYTKSMIDINHWLVCDGDSQVVTCAITCIDDIKSHCLYYVRPSRKSMLVDIEGVYIADIVRHAITEFLITFDEIVYVLPCRSVEYDFAPVVDKVYQTTADDALSKHVMNHVIGTFVDMQRKSCKIRFSFGSETDACTRAIKALTNENQLLRPVRMGDDVWKIISQTKTRNKRSTVLMNVQIVQNARLSVYQTAKRLEHTSGGKLVQIKTDSFTIADGNHDVLTSFVRWRPDTIGGYKIDKFASGHTSRKVQKSPYARQVAEPTIYNMPSPDLPDINALADLVEKVKRISIEGFAGTGKTTLLKLLVEELKRRGHEVQTASYQNNVAEKFDGKSIHKTYSVNIEGERSKHNRVGKQAVVIDEQSMIPRHLWEIIEETKHDILVSCGDFDQLPPVNEQTDRSHTDIYRLVFPTVVRLSQVHRTSDPELMKIIEECRRGNTSNVTVSTSAPLTTINVCDTNRKRREINDMVIAGLNLPATHHFTNVKRGEKYKQPYSLTVGMPLIRLSNEESNVAIKNLPEPVKAMANASKWLVKSVENDTVTLSRLIDFEETSATVSFDLSDKWFAHVFTPAYAVTLYKAQGDTFRRAFTIWEWTRIKRDRRYAYVAMSRATRLNDISVIL